MNFLKNNDSLYLRRVPDKIAVFRNASGAKFRDAYPRRLEGTIDGTPVKLISLADLRADKQTSATHKGLADLDRLPTP